MTDPKGGKGTAEESIRVLVADDNPARAGLLIEFLESRCYAVDWARDGDHALAMAASGAYQVMLLDVHMTLYDGVEVMRRLYLLEGRPVRVIAITADRLATRRAELSRMDVEGYLAKLGDELDRVLRKSGE